MKKIDTQERVMERIVAYEQSRSTLWLRMFFVAMTGFLFSIGSLLLYVGVKFVQLGTGDVLVILGEDREIIVQFWQDIVVVFWEEFPYLPLLIALGIAIIAGCFFFYTSRKRHIMQRRKLQSLQLSTMIKKK